MAPLPSRPSTPLARQLARLEHLPGSLRLKSWVLGFTVPFAGRAGVRVVAIEPGRACLALPDRRRVHNHLGGIHASAAALLAEATSGVALMYHLPAGRVPLLKRMAVDYTRRIRGDLIAVAELDAATADRLASEPAGEHVFLVTVRDASGEEPLRAEMTWAWRPRHPTPRAQ